MIENSDSKDTCTEF